MLKPNDLPKPTFAYFVEYKSKKLLQKRGYLADDQRIQKSCNLLQILVFYSPCLYVFLIFFHCNFYYVVLDFLSKVLGVV